jgi:hypothetical protein
MLEEIEKAPSAESAFPEMSSAGCLDNSENSQPRQNTQIKFQDAVSTEFGGEIALALADTGWRHSRGPVNRGVPAGAPITDPPFPPYLRLVPPPSPPRPRHLEVRVIAADRRMPVGRTRIFRLTDRDFEQLINVATLLEARR